MKKTNTAYWIITGLFSAFMLVSSIPDIILNPEAKEFMHHLGYPDYFTRFIGVLKVIGAIAILIPGYPRIKEWAYAGFIFDLSGATWSQLATDGLLPQVFFMAIPIAFCALSYIYHHKRLKAKGAETYGAYAM